jgi:copper resistance protein B
MKPKETITRPAIGTVFLLIVIASWPTGALAQDDMKGMPGMAPTPTATPTPTPAAAATQKKMDAMPGMNPANSPAEKSNGATPAKDSMNGMPGMSGSSAPPRIAKPGITVLGPHRKWVPPSGDNRAAELIARPILEHNLNQPEPPVMDSHLYSFSLFDLLEYRANSAGPDTFVWDFVGWYGGDYNRLWVKTEGSQNLSQGNRGGGDLQFLYGRLIAPFWDFQIGARALTNLGNGSLRHNARTYVVIGFQGLAPGKFDVEPAIYISDHGEVSGELTVSADVSLTQRLILQPRFQGEVSAQGDRRFGTGSGVTQTDIGLRLRYEIRRELSPYIGVSWLRSYGSTASIARAGGEPDNAVGFVTGFRLWW